MEQDKHEHNMVPVDYPAVSFAKTVCKIILVLCVSIIIAGYSSPVVGQFVNANSYWIVGILGGIVGSVFVIALLQAFSR